MCSALTIAAFAFPLEMKVLMGALFMFFFEEFLSLLGFSFRVLVYF